MDTVPVPTVRESRTATALVLTAISTPPVTVNPAVAATVTVAARLPATPALETTNIPIPPDAVMIGSSTGPNARRPFAMPTRTTEPPAALVACSNVKSPETVWPATVRFTAVPPRRTNFVPAAVLKVRAKSPENATPGAVTAMVTSTVPLTPAAVRSKVAVVPVFWVAVSGGAPDVPPNRSTRFSSATVRVTTPEVSVRVTTTSADRCWPRMSRVMAVPATRTYWPAGSVSVVVAPAIVNDCSTASVPVLNSTARAPESPTCGTATVTVPVTRPANPSAVRRKSAVPFVRVIRAGSPPSAALTLVAPIRRTCRVGSATPAAVTAATRSTTTSAERLWPRTVSVSPIPSKRR